MGSYKARRVIVVIILLFISAIPLSQTALELPTLGEVTSSSPDTPSTITPELASLTVKGRAPKTGYDRTQFGNGWANTSGCDTRNRILARDLTGTKFDDQCRVLAGTLNDPYTGGSISFTRGETTSDDVQIDHVVALSNAWQTGAQQLTYERRVELANDPLNLLAVDGPTNEKKSDGDAATWLPPNKAFRCQYVERQVGVKQKYQLWVTSAERDAISRILNSC